MAKPEGDTPVTKILKRVVKRDGGQDDPAPVETETEDVPETDEPDQDVDETEDAEPDVETEDVSDEDSEDDPAGEAIDAEVDKPDDEDESEGDADETQTQTYSPEYVKKLREEAKRRRLEATKAKDKLAELESKQKEARKKAERAKMDEVSRLQAELKEKDEQLEVLELGITQVAKENAVITKATQMGFRNAKDAVILLSNVMDDLELSEDGEVDPIELEEALSNLAVERPYLIEDKPKAVVSKKVVVSADRKGEDSKRKASSSRKSKDKEIDDQLTKEIIEANAKGDGHTAFAKTWERRLRRAGKFGNPIWQGRKIT